MPSARVMRWGAKISSAPNPRLNQPRFLAIRSEAPNELGPVLMTFGSPCDLAMFETFSIIMVLFLADSGLENDFDAAVLLVAEHLVHFRSLFEAHSVSDDKGGIDVAFLDVAEQFVGPAVDVGLSGPNTQSLVHQLPHRDLVDEAAIHTGDRKDAARAADINHLAQHVRAIILHQHYLLGAV